MGGYVLVGKEDTEAWLQRALRCVASDDTTALFRLQQQKQQQEHSGDSTQSASASNEDSSSSAGDNSGDNDKNTHNASRGTHADDTSAHGDHKHRQRQLQQQQSQQQNHTGNTTYDLNMSLLAPRRLAPRQAVSDDSGMRPRALFLAADSLHQLSGHETPHRPTRDDSAADASLLEMPSFHAPNMSPVVPRRNGEGPRARHPARHPLSHRRHDEHRRVHQQHSSSEQAAADISADASLIARF
ncbi:MAG: hypothetical protein MHM6MM_008678 [Cercozoa sp. M6MM]